MAVKLAGKLADNEAFASMRYVGMSPQKVRLVADLVRGKKAVEALNLLRFTPKAAAEPVSKVIASAMANAAENKQLNPNELVVSRIWVDGGPIRQWRRFAARGRFRPIQRKSCHINVIVSEPSNQAAEE
ncbi:MAG: 50S ribosomal protein L22 [Anaerolineae bacterium]|nr:50S ribosomal protein L22 [Thermoflexales bacterium]MDW8409015.1 50S ribosomal protein L22 [Anaerolineae bacterium]